MTDHLRFREDRPPFFQRRQRTFLVTIALILVTASSGLGQNSIRAAKSATNEEPAIREELTLKNGDRLTGRLLNSTGAEIKFKSDLAGEVTVEWKNVKELKSKREFAVIPKNIQDARNRKQVSEGAIEIGDNGIAVYASSLVKPEKSAASGGSEANANASTGKVLAVKEIPISNIGFVVDDATYQKEIHQKIGLSSGWDGHIATGSTMVLSTESSYLFHISAALTRTVPTVRWLSPKLRTQFNFTLSAGEATKPDSPRSTTNIYHADAERDKYFGPRGYYLQMLSLDHNSSQGLLLQQNYGGGVGATLFKRKNSELDVAIDLNYGNQQFNATADVSQINLNLIGTSLTESYARRFGRIHFDEKILANIAFNNVNASSASGTSSMRIPVYKKLGFNAAVIDNLLNNPQVGFKKNSLQFSTGFSLSLH